MTTRKFLSKLIPALPMLLAAALVILVTVIFLTAMRSKAHAQFGGAEQPMFQLASSGLSDPMGSTNLVYWWVASDLAAGATASWADRVRGQTLIQPTAGNQPTANGTNLTFVSASANVISNTLSVGFTMNPGYSFAWIASHGPGYQTASNDRFLFHNTTIGFQYRQNGGVPCFSDNISGGFNYVSNEAWLSNNIVHDIVMVIHDLSLDCYTNGVLSATRALGSTVDWPANLVLGNSSDMIRPWKGSVYELQIHSNIVTSAQITQYHSYATNKYGYSP